MRHPIEPKAQTWVLALTSVASLMLALDVLVVSTALNQIGKDFAAPVEALGWTVNAYVLTFAVLLMTAAVAGDRYGTSPAVRGRPFWSSPWRRPAVRPRAASAG